ncbi:MAG TPA: L-histidine N(alpha)-methyltransferase, partial [Isosphaeraceae bacterium]|nr:L-histidine N(alpha)-methyltransferase [Isosphaeraceae bacterium]
TDLVKDRAILEAAYNDSQGVTARFNLNLLARINRELGANFNLSTFAHRALYVSDLARIEMHLESQADQEVQIPGAQFMARFGAGEWIHTENSHKYTPEALAALAERSGFVEEAAWTDRENRFRVQRWRVAGVAR